MVKLKALVTGARGHTGSFLVHLLSEEGWDVVATDLESSKREKVMKKEKVFGENFKYMNINLPNVQFIPADLTDRDSLRQLFNDELKNYDVVFHPASLYDYFAEIDTLRKINVGGLKNLLEVMLETLGKDKLPRFIHWSTCGVYGEPVYEKNENGYPIAADESTPYNPPNNYSISKMEQEVLLKDFSKKHGLKFTIIRPAPIYGPYQVYGAFHLFYLAHKMGYTFIPRIHPAKKKLMMPMVHVEDLVRAALYLSRRDDAIDEAFNVVGDYTTEEDWLEFLYEELGIGYIQIPIWFPFWKIIAKLTFNYGKSLTKKARKLGVRPKVDLPMIGYLTHQYFFSNEKLKSTGFQFKYADPFKGTRQTLNWYKDAGWIKNEEKIIVRNNGERITFSRYVQEVSG
ncbi:MAG: NAD-dependent epimerase/dehydratase family protein [Promethearchaeota archaeon]